MSPAKKTTNQTQKTKTVILENGTRIIRAYKAGICSYCKKPFQRGEEFKWEPKQKLGYCTTCPAVPQFILENGSVVPFLNKDKKNFVPMKTSQKTQKIVQKVVTHEKSNEPIQAKDIFDGKYAYPFRMKNNPDRSYIVFNVRTFSNTHKFKGYRIIRVQHDNDWLNVALIKSDNTLQPLSDYKYDPTLQHVKVRIIEVLTEKLVLLDDNTLAGYGLLYTKVTKKCWSCSQDISEINEKKHGLCDTCFDQIDAEIVDVRMPTFILPF